MKVNHKVIVVTGAGSGMGRQIAINLAMKGASLALVDIHARELEETAKLCQISGLSTHLVNIADKDRVEELPDAIIQKHGVVDGLINNAGIIQPFVPVSELDYQTIDRIIQVNFYGTLYMTKSFLPYLLKRPEAHIVNVSSMGGFIPFPGQTLYGSSKAAVKILTEGLYAELKNTPVNITCVLPGAVHTNILANSGVRSTFEEAAADNAGKNRALSAEKAASIIVRAMEQNRFSVLVGSDARLLNFLYRIHPEWAIRFIVNQMDKLVKKNSRP